MSQKKNTPKTSSTKLSAGIGGVAKASYERKKSGGEVIPPDVTRAKAVRWLDLISPITEWAGLKGDGLRHKREQLRVHQEAALDELALKIRNKIGNHKVLHPLPPKILVPALEAASLEEPASPLIDWWADLLVSSATNKEPRPFFIQLMSQSPSGDFIKDCIAFVT
jgi:hypothetical protein